MLTKTFKIIQDIADIDDRQLGLQRAAILGGQRKNHRRRMVKLGFRRGEKVG
jgi:hypothetical protein